VGGTGLEQGATFSGETGCQSDALRLALQSANLPPGLTEEILAFVRSRLVVK